MGSWVMVRGSNWVPNQIKPRTADWVELGVGGAFTCGIKSSSFWGSDEYGQLGDGGSHQFVNEDGIIDEKFNVSPTQEFPSLLIG